MEISREMAEAAEESFVENIPDKFIDLVQLRRPAVTMQGKSVLSFRETMRAAEVQIEIHCFVKADRAYARDVCRVIAEVYMMPEGASVKIEGEMLPAVTVRQIFSEITHEHVNFVLGELREYKGRIISMKGFLRTLLYNSVLSMESAETKEFEDEDF